MRIIKNGGFALVVILILLGCGGSEEPVADVVPTDDIHAPTFTGAERNFTTSFELESDFSGFYITPQGDYDTNHTLDSSLAIDGTFSHKAWILQQRDTDNESTGGYLPHRGYPTVQFQKTAEGIFRTPCLVSLFVYLDMNLSVRTTGVDDWFSFITLSPDSSDYWSRTVLVNLSPDTNYSRLVHVPNQGEQVHLYQVDNNASLLFPQKTWVRYDVLIDFAQTGGYAKVWQDGTLISHASVNGGLGGLAQAHFGMYSAAAVASGTIYNDHLRIIEVADEAAALPLVNTAY